MLILRTIDRLEVSGQTAELSSGSALLLHVTGGQRVTDDGDHRRFIRELEMAETCGWLGYKVRRWGTQPTEIEVMGANNYLAQLSEIHLSPLGRDRARCRVFESEPPDPAEDDGSPITLLTLSRISEIMAAAYGSDRLAMFLTDGGIPKALVPDLEDAEQGLMRLFALLEEASPYRRILRAFLGSWLSQGLAVGPDADQENELLLDLARQGWFVRDDRLARGEPVRRAALAPILGGDLLSNLHPTIQAAARGPFTHGQRAAAVFEAFKAVELGVKELLPDSAESGVKLMAAAFDGATPRLTINSGSEPGDSDERSGFALIFKGAMWGIRNPKAHAPFEELDERRTLDYLGFASLLMGRLDDATPP